MAAATKAKEEEVVDTAEVIEPLAETREVRLGLEENGTLMVFEQRPLSLFGKIDFFSVMGKALDRAMSGPDGISLADLMDAPSSATELREADLFIRGISKLAAYAPEIMGDIYCVILAVPRGSREFAKQVMELPQESGGFTDDEGLGVLETFVDQNWDVIMDFFNRAQGLGKKIQEKAASRR
jgi:hypothetical protein